MVCSVASAGEGEGAARQQRPRHHPRQHEQRRDREVEEVQHADGEREGDRDGHVDRAEQEAGNDLAHDHGAAGGDGECNERDHREKRNHRP